MSNHMNKWGANLSTTHFDALFFRNNRNFTIVSRKGKFVLYFRFIGHHFPEQNHQGLVTLLMPSVQQELLSNASSCWAALIEGT